MFDYAVTRFGRVVSLRNKGRDQRLLRCAVAEKGHRPGRNVLASDAAYQARLTALRCWTGKAMAIDQNRADRLFSLYGLKDGAGRGDQPVFKPVAKSRWQIHRCAEKRQIDAWSIVPHIAKPHGGVGRGTYHSERVRLLPTSVNLTAFTSTKNATDEKAANQDTLQLCQGGCRLQRAMIEQTAGAEGVAEMVKADPQTMSIPTRR